MMTNFKGLTCPGLPAGETQSEGGFAPNRVSAASILDIGTTTDKKGKEYYTYEILTRTGRCNCSV